MYDSICTYIHIYYLDIYVQWGKPNFKPFLIEVYGIGFTTLNMLGGLMSIPSWTFHPRKLQWLIRPFCGISGTVIKRKMCVCVYIKNIPNNLYNYVCVSSLSVYLSIYLFIFLSYPILSYFIFSYRILSYLSYLILSCLILSYITVSHLFLSYLILSYLILSYLIVSYLILPYLILSYPIYLSI